MYKYKSQRKEHSNHFEKQGGENTMQLVWGWGEELWVQFILRRADDCQNQNVG